MARRRLKGVVAEKRRQHYRVKNRLNSIAKTVLELNLTRYEIPIRQWALQDKRAARVLKNVNQIHLDFVREAFSELGFTGDDLEMRTMLFVCYLTWEAPMFREISHRRCRELIRRRIELLTQQLCGVGVKFRHLNTRCFSIHVFGCLRRHGN